MDWVNGKERQKKREKRVMRKNNTSEKLKRTNRKEGRTGKERKINGGKTKKEEMECSDNEGITLKKKR